jgi:predicted aspartyl protease
MVGYTRAFVKLTLRDGLPFIEASIEYQGKSLTIRDVLVDTGSAGSVFSADAVEKINLVYEPQDRVQRVQGVGGAEFVFTKRIDRLAIGTVGVDEFDIAVGSVDYGFNINGIIGMNWLIAVQAIVDLSNLVLRSA